MNIYEYVNGQITSYPSREIELYNTRQFNQYELINQIAAYTDSHYTSGQYDELGRRKPFHNVTSRLLLKQRASEDIDTKDIELSTTRPDHYAKSMIMTVANKKWMKLVNFSKTLNEMTQVRGRDGGVLVKKVMKEGQLHIEVVDFLSTVTDPTDIASGAKIQEFKYNAAELMDMKKNGWENVEEAITTAEEQHDTKEEGSNPGTDYVTVYVIDGVLKRTMIDEDADEFTYSQQLHIITLHDTEGEDGEKEQAGITLYSSELKDSPFKYLPYEVMSGRSLGRGMVEQAFEAQMSINEAVINEKNTMEISAKAILWQPTGNGSQANNIISDVQDGAMLDYNIAMPQMLQATPNSLAYNRTIVDGWQQQIDAQVSIFDANTGNSPASATFRGQALNSEHADAPFKNKKEDMDIFLREIYTDWIIPHLKKWVKTQDFLELELSADQMKRVITDFSYNTARKIVDDRYFAGKYDDAEPGTKFDQMALDTEMESQRVKDAMNKQTKNWIKSDSKYLDGIEFDLDIIITDEQKIKQVFLSNQIDLLNSYLSNRDAFANDPNAMKQYNAIQETLGQEPLESIDVPVQEGELQGNPVSVTEQA